MAKWHDNSNDIIKKSGVEKLVVCSIPIARVCSLIVIIRKTSMNDMLGSSKIAAE